MKTVSSLSLSAPDVFDNLIEERTFYSRYKNKYRVSKTNNKLISVCNNVIF